MKKEESNIIINIILEISILLFGGAILFVLINSNHKSNMTKPKIKVDKINMVNKEEKDAYQITNSTIFNITNSKSSISISKITDEDYTTYIKVDANSTIEINNGIQIKSLYIMYELKGYKGTLEYNNKTIEIGNNNFIHEYIDIPEASNSIKIRYDENAIITDIYVFSKGKTPNYVQKWKVNNNKTDLLLFSTHSDDEHLMFAGLIPTYIARGYNVEVAYMTNHINNNQSRYHELLNGLWVAGVTNYPELGPFPDQHSRDLNKAIKKLEIINIKQDDIINWQVETIRKYKPSVVVGHAENGEYGHGQHRLNSKCLEQAVVKAEDPEYSTNNYNKPWKINKTYIHLYDKNRIEINIDTPLDYYNGLTALQVSQLAIKEHKSQIKSGWVYKWLCGPNGYEITKSTQITKYFPNQFGLFRTNVGKDIKKDDIFENITKK